MEIEHEVRRQYLSVRSGIPDGAPVTALRIGADQTAIASGTGNEPRAVLILAIGSRKTAAAHFKHNPPTAGELESAIASVEDELIRARPLLAGASTLFTTDTAVREIALIAGLPDQAKLILTREAIERTFERLAAVALGRPVAYEGIPATAEFAATLLMLRECMHHLGFPAIVVRT